LWKISKTKYLASAGKKHRLQKLYVNSLQAGKFETDQPRGFENSQHREFWNSQPQCPCGRLPPEIKIERKRFSLRQSAKQQKAQSLVDQP
jgi:hypothetical protein